MFRYRIARNAQGRYVVFPAIVSVVPIGDTYATRKDAQETANWLNSLPGDPLHGEGKALPVHAPETFFSGGGAQTLGAA